MSAPPRYDRAWGWVLFFTLIWVLLAVNVLNQISHLSGNGGIFR